MLPESTSRVYTLDVLSDMDPTIAVREQRGRGDAGLEAGYARFRWGSLLSTIYLILRLRS